MMLGIKCLRGHDKDLRSSQGCWTERGRGDGDNYSRLWLWSLCRLSKSLLKALSKAEEQREPIKLERPHFNTHVNVNIDVCLRSDAEKMEAEHDLTNNVIYHLNQ